MWTVFVCDNEGIKKFEITEWFFFEDVYAVPALKYVDFIIFIKWPWVYYLLVLISKGMQILLEYSDLEVWILICIAVKSCGLWTLLLTSTFNLVVDGGNQTNANQDKQTKTTTKCAQSTPNQPI